MNNEINAIGRYNSTLKNNIDTLLKNELIKYGHSDIKPSYGMILYLVFNEGEKIQIKELYNRINKNKPTITEMINKLVKLGYLEKEVSREDKRVSFVKTTKKSLEFKDYFQKISNNLLKTTFNGFSSKEKQEFIRLFKKANNNFNNLV